jgi:hypothetical protein
MSQEMIAALITSGCIAVLVLWIPAICLARHCIHTLRTKTRTTDPGRDPGEMEKSRPTCCQAAGTNRNELPNVTLTPEVE